MDAATLVRTARHRSGLTQAQLAARLGTRGVRRGDRVLALLPAGTALRDYRVERVLGEGGFGTVWLAERNDGRFQGKAAIKLLHGGLLRPADQERFRREASALARLSHPNIARLIDADVNHRVPYLAFQPDRIGSEPVLPIDEVETSYYLRPRVDDKPGVLADITRIRKEELQ